MDKKALIYVNLLRFSREQIYNGEISTVCCEYTKLEILR